MDLKSLLFVFIGSGIGGALRYFISKTLSASFPLFPYGTMVSNLLGMFLIGILSIWLVDKNMLGSPFREMILVGFLGGLTTFSTFGNETYLLVKQNRWDAVFFYLFGNLFIGFLLLILGKYLGRI